MKMFSRLAASCVVLIRPSACQASPILSAPLVSRAALISSFHHRPPQSSAIPPLRIRHNSTSTTASNRKQTASGPPTGEAQDPNSERLRQTPAYELTFTCKPCKGRSAHRISKQGYHKGTVLITCPECKNRHVISDHLKIFSDTSMTIEDLMRDNGELMKKGSLSPDGDIEFWDDGSTSRRTEMEGSSLPKELNSA